MTGPETSLGTTIATRFATVADFKRLIGNHVFVFFFVDEHRVRLADVEDGANGSSAASTDVRSLFRVSRARFRVDQAAEVLLSVADVLGVVDSTGAAREGADFLAAIVVTRGFAATEVVHTGVMTLTGIEVADHRLKWRVHCHRLAAARRVAAADFLLPRAPEAVLGHST